MGKFEKGKIFRVEELIDYADGGIVSKELIHNPSGSVTLFSFDIGQGLSEHTAPYDALLYVFEGEMELVVEDTIHIVKSGESFIIPSGARHAVNAAVRFKMVITMIRG
jgi:cupin region protein